MRLEWTIWSSLLGVERAVLKLPVTLMFTECNRRWKKLFVYLNVQPSFWFADNFYLQLATALDPISCINCTVSLSWQHYRKLYLSVPLSFIVDQEQVFWLALLKDCNYSSEPCIM